jgi:Rrf2 family protein
VICNTYGVRVSAKTDYALRALIEISQHQGNGPITAEELGRLQQIPHGFLQAILADLRKDDIVIAQRGKKGGWRLCRQPEQISVADVIRSVDGPLVSVYGLRPEAVEYAESTAILQHVWIAARSALREVFEQVSVADLAQGRLPDELLALTSAEDAWHAH